VAIVKSWEAIRGNDISTPLGGRENYQKVAVRIRLKRMGRKHRPFFRVCATDARSPRDGKVIEELGYYDPMVKETDARAKLKGDRIDYWLSVGARPSENVRVLIKKYGTNGTHLEQQKMAFERLNIRPQAPAPVPIPRIERVSATQTNEGGAVEPETVIAEAGSE
jgi:small subunit ribosomal protein S16